MSRVAGVEGRGLCPPTCPGEETRAASSANPKLSTAGCRKGVSVKAMASTDTYLTMTLWGSLFPTSPASLEAHTHLCLIRTCARCACTHTCSRVVLDDAFPLRAGTEALL